ncbi:MAG: OPT/YSL family transporter, partial [Myxococcota bacterium]
ALLVVGLEGPLVASALGLSDAGALGAWNVWPATALLTAAASTHFVSSLALKQATSMPVRGDALRWALLAGAGAGLVCVFGFDAPWWAALLAVVLAPLACVIVIRMAGETDVTAGLPLAMGLQVLFGLALPFGVGAHLASAGVLAGATATAADQVGDVKTGTLVGLEPRRQLVGQLLGCVVGSVVAVAGFVLLTAGKVGDARWPVPAAQQFLALGRAASGEAGLDARLLVAVGGAAVVGLLLALLERTRWVRWLPSPMGLGVALLVPPALSLTIGVGAVLGFLLRRRRWLTGAAAGLMVGETVGELVATLRGLS